MSNIKSWRNDPLERKEPKSIYLTQNDWNYLYDVDSSPTEAIRKLIMDGRKSKEEHISGCVND